MELQTLKLKNWGCHKSLVVDFRPGLNAIVGSNGSGKTRIMVAVLFALTGEIVEEGNKLDNLTYGEERGSVELLFSHQGADYKIKRAIESTRQSMTLPDGKEITRAAEIQAKVEEILQTPTAAILTNVFSMQGRLDAIFGQTATKRLQEFQEIFHLDRAKKGADVLQLELQRLHITPGLDQQVLELTAKKAALSDEILSTRTKSESLGQSITTLTPQRLALAKVMEARRNLTAARELEAQVTKLTAEVAALQQGYGQMESTYRAQFGTFNPAQVQAEKTALNDQLNQLKFDLQRYRQQQDKALKLAELQERISRQSVPPQEVITNYQAELDAGRQRLLQLRVPVQPTPELVLAVSSARDNLQRLSSLPESTPQLDDLRLRLKESEAHTRLAEMGKCPTCGSATVNSTEHLINLQKERDSLREQVGALENKLREMRKAVLNNAQLKVQQAEEAVNADLLRRRKEAEDEAKAVSEKLTQDSEALRLASGLIQQHLDMKQQIAVLQAGMGVSTEVPDEAKIAELEGHLQRLTKWEAEEKTLRDAMTNAATALRMYQENLQRTSSSLNAIGQAYDLPSDEIIRQMMMDADELQRVEGVFADTQRRLKDIEIEAEAVTSRLTALIGQQKKEAKDASWAKICQRARELLHVTGYPAIAMREYSSILNGRIQYYLRLWNAPFNMHLDDDMQFQVEFLENVRRHTAARLSGGQKVVAATAFRFAMTDTFARGVGLLAMDEPTVFLDKASIDQFGKLLLQLKELSRSEGRQILLVTHEVSLNGMFDHVVEVG